MGFSFTGVYMDKVLNENDLPVKMVAYGRCFRTEAGAAGAAGKGLYRVHQFTKVCAAVLTNIIFTRVWSECEYLTTRTLAAPVRGIDLLSVASFAVDICHGAAAAAAATAISAANRALCSCCLLHDAICCLT